MLLCGIAAFFAYAYFYGAGGWNQNTRFDLVRALVEQRGIRLDDYHDNTGDIALFASHYYADKAPGASFVAAPVVALARAAMRLVHTNTKSHANLMRLSYVASLSAAAFPAALAVMCVWHLARRMGASKRGATVVALAFGLGTPFWAWATVFYSHTLSAACLLGAFVAAVHLGDPLSRPGRDVQLGGAVGLLVGWAVVTEFPTVVPGAIVAVFALWQARRDDVGRLVRVAASVAIAGGACAVVLGGALTMRRSARPSTSAMQARRIRSSCNRGSSASRFRGRRRCMAQLLWGSFLAACLPARSRAGPRADRLGHGDRRSRVATCRPCRRRDVSLRASH